MDFQPDGLRNMLDRLKKNFWLILIILLALLLRIWRLGEAPPSLSWDEAALGYNAYSILRTGRDEYGQFLPLIFKSFGDYKPGLYVYLAVPFVAILGLTELAVRLPSAILGSLGVLGIYLLAKEMFSPRQFPNPSGLESSTRRVSPWRGVPLLSALLLAISPWHINFSRGAWEANAALFFVLAGVVVFLWGVREFGEFGRLKFLFFSSLFFVFSFYTYQGAKLFVPLLISGLVLIYRKKLLRLSRRQILIVLLPFVLAIPLYLGVLGKAGGRLKVMSVFSNPRPEGDIEAILTQGRTTQNSLLFKFFHSEALNFARGILGRYFNHFSGRFLFFEGDWQNPRLGVPYMGILYFIESPLLLLGLSSLAKSKGRSKYFLLWWLLIAPIPAALSRDAVSSVRALPMVIPLVVLVAFGVREATLFLGKKPRLLCVTCSVLLVAIYSWCFGYYLDQYYVHRAKKYSQTTQYGYREVVNFIYSEFLQKYSQIIFTQKYGQPYIYWLFYTRLDPTEYQKQAWLIESPYGDVGRVKKINNVEFQDVYWPADRGIKNSLFIGTELELPLKDIDPNQANILKEVRFLDGQLAFRVVDTK